VGVVFIAGQRYYLTGTSSGPLETDISAGVEFYVMQITPCGQRSNSGVLKLLKQRKLDPIFIVYSSYVTGQQNY